MKCDFCKRDEIEINEIFAPIIDSIKKIIADIDIEIKEKTEKYPREHGFIDENFSKVRKNNTHILEIKINAFLSNLEPFIKIEPNLEILYKYYKNYNPEINQEETLQILTNLFTKEPTQIRLENEFKALFHKRDILMQNIETIEKKNIFKEFYDNIGIPLNVFQFDPITYNNIITELDNSKIILLPRPITLCPYCFNLFTISSEKLSILKEQEIEAKRKALIKAKEEADEVYRKELQKKYGHIGLKNALDDK
jgi:hypothetical protein